MNTRLPRTLVGLAIAVGMLLPTSAASGIEIRFGGGSKLDMGKLRKAITDNAKKAYEPAKIGPVTCPSSRKIKKGDVFTCTVPVADGILTITVTQKDGDGNVRFVAKQAVIDLDKAEAFVHGQVLSQTKTDAAVDCGRTTVKIVEPGKFMDCTATADDGSVLKLRLTVKDVDGNVSLSSVGT